MYSHKKYLLSSIGTTILFNAFLYKFGFTQPDRTDASIFGPIPG